MNYNEIKLCVNEHDRYYQFVLPVSNSRKVLNYMVFLYGARERDGSWSFTKKLSLDEFTIYEGFDALCYMLDSNHKDMALMTKELITSCFSPIAHGTVSDKTAIHNWKEMMKDEGMMGILMISSNFGKPESKIVKYKSPKTLHTLMDSKLEDGGIYLEIFSCGGKSFLMADESVVCTDVANIEYFSNAKKEEPKDESTTDNPVKKKKTFADLLREMAIKTVDVRAPFPFDDADHLNE